MSKHEGCIRGFYQTSRAWYGEASLRSADYSDEITIGFYAEGGGTSGEFNIRWYELSGDNVPKLEVFNDAFDALFSMQDLLSELALHDDADLTPDALRDILIANGFKDMTPVTRDGVDDQKYIDGLITSINRILLTATAEQRQKVIEKLREIGQ